MSTNPPIFSPEGSDQIFNSETGELIYSPKKTIWVDIYAEANRVQKLQESISSLGSRFKINTPPPPSPDFLSNAYYRSAPEDLSKYSDFEDFLRVNINRYNI